MREVITISHSTSQGTTMEQLVAQILNTDPAAAAAAAARSKKQMYNMQQAALRVTAARFRKKILGVYETNPFGWEKHREYSNWFGSAGSVVIGDLARMNRPIKSLTKKGMPRKKGYSTKPAIKAPQPHSIGGRLMKGTRYKVDDGTMTVGILNTSRETVKTKMEGFQDGGVVNNKGAESSRKYLAAIGIYIRRSTVLTAKARPLYAPLVQQDPPEKIFSSAFAEMLLDKMRIGEN